MTSSGLHFFAGFSLVDITATGVIRGNNDDVKRDQQRNWETVLQCIGLRTQPHHVQEPDFTVMDVEGYNFGEMYTGKQKIWTWTWAVEREEVYDFTNKPLGGLFQDFEQVPIIVGLEETARFLLPIFYPYGPIKNIYFTTVSLE